MKTSKARLVVTKHYDALVVGAGPAGSMAALVLARSGARVALVDKSGFPRDKACGDLIGPRGVQTLADLGVPLEGPRVGDMEVIGPTGRRVVLPARPGVTYPGYAVVARRARFDALLHETAVAAGAEPVTGRAGEPLGDDRGEVRGFAIDEEKGRPVRLTAELIIGADGALSRVGAAAGLVNERQVLWGFAIRAYTEQATGMPRIHFWEPSPGSGFPGYGWVFPGDSADANVGLGVGSRGDRRGVARVSTDLTAFLAAAGVDPGRAGRALGGWIKMGMVGTVPARGRTLLVGDAAGLVNPLQGEGIAQALGSGRAAAEAFLSAGSGGAARAYMLEIARLYGRYAATTAPVCSWMLRRPRAQDRIARLLCAPGVSRLVAGGWALYWNDLLGGATPGWPRLVARAADMAGRLLTWRAADRRMLRHTLGEPAEE